MEKCQSATYCSGNLRRERHEDTIHGAKVYRWWDYIHPISASDPGSWTEKKQRLEKQCGLRCHIVVFSNGILNDDLDNHLIIWGQGIKFGKGETSVFRRLLSDNGIPHVKSVKCRGITCLCIIMRKINLLGPLAGNFTSHWTRLSR